MTGTVMTATDLALCWNAPSAGVFSTQRARMTTQSSRMKTRLSVLFARYTCHFNVVVMQTNGNDVAILAWLMGLHEIFREGWQWASEQTIKFWWRSDSRIPNATLIRRALAEVCTVSVLLVSTD